jgi:hypothetical protein
MGKGKAKEIKMKPFLVETVSLKATGVLDVNGNPFMDFEDGSSKPLAELLSRFNGENIVLSVSLKNDMSGIEE